MTFKPRCHRVRICRVMLVLAVLLGVSLGSLAQAPILRFSFEDTSLIVPVGGMATSRLRITNDSVYDADDIEISLLSGPVDLSPIEPIEVIGAFSSDMLSVQLQAGTDAAIGSADALFELSYTYCIGDLCFQIVEDISLALEFIPAPIEPIDGPMIEPVVDPVVVPDLPAPIAKRSFWPRLLPIGLGVILVAAVVLSKVIGQRWWVLGLFAVVLAAGLGYGISLRQDQQAQSIGAVLCTSCVGIEETPHNDPELSRDGRLRVEALSTEIELRLFSATWCHACPYAKELVRQVTELNPLITSQVIDVDVDREAADRYGIIQSGRTIVPAILRVDTGEVLFGIEDLEERLIVLLEETR